MSSTSTTFSPFGGFDELLEAQRNGIAVCIGPVDLAGMQGFANAVGNRDSGIGTNDGEFADHGADFGIATEAAAQANAEHLGVLVVAKCQGDLNVLIGVHSVRVFEMTMAQSAGFAQEADYFVVVGISSIASG